MQLFLVQRYLVYCKLKIKFISICIIKKWQFQLFWTVGNYKTPSTVTRIASAILWVLSDFILYGLFSLAPFIYSNLFDIKHSSYPLIYGIYIWGSVFLLRSLLFAVPDFAISKKCLRILLFTSLCSIILYFTSTDNDLRFTCLISTVCKFLI